MLNWSLTGRKVCIVDIWTIVILAAGDLKQFLMISSNIFLPNPVLLIKKCLRSPTARTVEGHAQIE